MTQTRTRSGVVIPSADGSDFWGALVSILRGMGDVLDQKTALWAGANPRSARPAAGIAGRLFRPTDRPRGVLDFDDGSAWWELGAPPPGNLAGDGIIDDLTGGSFKTTLVDSTHATVAAGTAYVRGQQISIPAPVTVTLPAATYKLIVLRLDMTTGSASIVVIGSSSYSVTVTQEPFGTWDIPMAIISGGTVVLDRRVWLGPHLYMDHPSANSHAQQEGITVPIGTKVTCGHEPGSQAIGPLQLLRGLDADGAPSWIQITPEPWHNVDPLIDGSDTISSGGNVVPSSGPLTTVHQALRWRQHDGAVEISGARTKALTGSSSASPWTSAGTYKIAEFPAAAMKITSRHYFSGVAVNRLEPYIAATVPVFLDSDSDGAVRSLYAVLPTGTWDVVAMSAVLQTPTYVT